MKPKVIPPAFLALLLLNTVIFAQTKTVLVKNYLGVLLDANPLLSC